MPRDQRAHVGVQLPHGFPRQVGIAIGFAALRRKIRLYDRSTAGFLQTCKSSRPSGVADGAAQEGRMGRSFILELCTRRGSAPLNIRTLRMLTFGTRSQQPRKSLELRSTRPDRTSATTGRGRVGPTRSKKAYSYCAVAASILTAAYHMLREGTSTSMPTTSATKARPPKPENLANGSAS
jgi:hypothetical protein